MTLGIPALSQDTAPSTNAVANSSSAVTASRTSSAGLHERNSRYRLRKGDTFDLDFALSPEFNQTVAVQPDGYITLKGAGSIFVEGQTVPELTETVKAAYAKTLHDPVIAIALKDFEKPYFIASGQVSKPGKYDLRSDLTVTEAVAIAGYEAKLLNVKKLLASRNLSEDVQLQPGDMLYVPQNAFSKIRPFLPTSSMGAYLGSGVL
jgi:polysaccharide export outer membrane protein